MKEKLFEKPDIRKLIEEREENLLSPKACLSKHGRRLKEEPPDPLRTAFQRDRDRIIHSKAFRRLKSKTQVFLAVEGDHFRTRLTHTLEVMQIARTIARSLLLNEDLVEAIALGHDLGHTPFGHTGEAVLNQLYPQGFHHAKQSLRVVDFIEREGKGLNLTIQVREGIETHSQKGKRLLPDIEAYPSTIEAAVVRMADVFAYINHDLDDAVRAGFFKKHRVLLPEESMKILGRTPSERIDTLVKDLVFNSFGKDYLQMSEEVLNALIEVRNFMYSEVYPRINGGREGKKAQKVVEFLYTHLLRHPEDITSSFFKKLYEENPEEAVKDYVAGMTDRFALNLYEKFTGEKIFFKGTP